MKVFFYLLFIYNTMGKFYGFKTVSSGTYPNIVGASIQVPYPGIASSERGTDRFLLRQGYNMRIQHVNGTNAANNTRKIGSFRALTNAGDTFNRKGYSCGGSNLIGSRPGMMVLSTKDGGQDARSCDSTGVPPATCNVKYVYDASDFIRFKKMMAKNKSYATPDYSYGGANTGTTQNVLNRVRR